MGRAIRGSTILFSEMTPQPAWEEAFNDWYDREHIPLRMACPGFLSAQRYLAPGGRNYLAVYEMGAPADLRTPEYAKVKGEPSDLTRRMLGGVSGFTRYIASEPEGAAASDPDGLEADCLLAVFCRVPEGTRARFESWARLARPASAAARLRLARYLKVSEGDPEDWSDLLLFYLDGDAHSAREVEPPSPGEGVATRAQVFARHGARQRAGG